MRHFWPSRDCVDNPHEEPVYNIDVVNIDDAAIIKTHDLVSARNTEIIRCYAERQPNRRVYLCDRSTRTLADFGPARTGIATTKGKATPWRYYSMRLIIRSGCVTARPILQVHVCFRAATSAIGPNSGGICPGTPGEEAVPKRFIFPNAGSVT